jgi:hypothetical protein
MVGFSYLQMRTPVSLAEHQTQLHQLWDALGLSDGDLDHLLALGLLPPDAFGKTGLFGLQTCIEVLQNASKELAEASALVFRDKLADARQFVTLQSTRAAGKECPIGHAADHVLFTLCTIWSIHTGQPTTSIPQPLLLSYPSVFRMAWKLLCRLWIESDATAADFDRLASVVDGFVAGVLREDANMGLRELEAYVAHEPSGDTDDRAGYSRTRRTNRSGTSRWTRRRWRTSCSTRLRSGALPRSMIQGI